jgi:hypothetical protein
VLENLIEQVQALDMDEVRKEYEKQQAAAEAEALAQTTEA